MPFPSRPVAVAAVSALCGAAAIVRIAHGDGGASAGSRVGGLIAAAKLEALHGGSGAPLVREPQVSGTLDRTVPAPTACAGGTMALRLHYGDEAPAPEPNSALGAVSAFLGTPLGAGYARYSFQSVAATTDTVTYRVATLGGRFVGTARVATDAAGVWRVQAIRGCAA